MVLAERLPPSDREWQTPQPLKGLAERLPPGPALWKMQGETARRARESSDQGEEASPEGLGGQGLLSQTDAGSPACQVVCQALHRKPGCVCGEACRGQMVQPHTVLEVADGVLYLCVAAMVGFKIKGISLAVGDEGVIAVADEQR